MGLLEMPQQKTFLIKGQLEHFLHPFHSLTWIDRNCSFLIELNRERKSDGCVEYPLKQKDCNVEYNTKEPEKNFGCDLVLTFENITRKEEGGLKKRKVEKRKRSAALVVKEKIPVSVRILLKSY